jgi:hypothetical protein
MSQDEKPLAASPAAEPRKNASEQQANEFK